MSVAAACGPEPTPSSASIAADERHKTRSACVASSSASMTSVFDLRGKTYAALAKGILLLNHLSQTHKLVAAMSHLAANTHTLSKATAVSHPGNAGSQTTSRAQPSASRDVRRTSRPRQLRMPRRACRGRHPPQARIAGHLRCTAARVLLGMFRTEGGQHGRLQKSMWSCQRRFSRQTCCRGGTRWCRRTAAAAHASAARRPPAGSGAAAARPAPRPAPPPHPRPAVGPCGRHSRTVTVADGLLSAGEHQLVEDTQSPRADTSSIKLQKVNEFRIPFGGKKIMT